VFVAVGDMLRGGFAPPALRAAALRVLEGTGHVTAQRGDDPAGRPAVQVSFVDQHARPGEVQTLYFDPGTSRIVQERMTGPGVTYLRTVTASGIVDAVPPAVLRLATTSGGTCFIGGSRHTLDACLLAFASGGPEDSGTASSGAVDGSAAAPATK